MWAKAQYMHPHMGKWTLKPCLCVPAFAIHLVRNNNENESNMKLNCSLLSGCEPLALIWSIHRCTPANPIKTCPEAARVNDGC